MDIIHSNRSKTSIANEGDIFTITQTYKNCSCQTSGTGTRQIKLHMKCKSVCGEGCLRFKYKNSD